MRGEQAVTGFILRLYAGGNDVKAFGFGDVANAMKKEKFGVDPIKIFFVRSDARLASPACRKTASIIRQVAELGRL